MKYVDSCISLFFREGSESADVVFDAYRESLIRAHAENDEPLLIFLNAIQINDIFYLSRETYAILINLAGRLLGSNFYEINVDHLDLNNQVKPPQISLNVAARSSPQAFEELQNRDDIWKIIIASITRE